MIRNFCVKSCHHSLTLSTSRSISCHPTETVLLFPGQGSQQVGMCGGSLRLSAVRDMFDEASEVLGYDLSRVCVDGPAEELSRTDVCQPALVVASLAAAKQYESSTGMPKWSQTSVAGFSVGEFTSLIYAGSIGFKAGIRLISARGKAMQDASERSPGAMLSLRGLKQDRVIELCKICNQQTAGASHNSHSVNDVDGFQLGISSFMAPEAFIVAGRLPAVELAEACALEMGASLVQQLHVSGAFHTPLMKTAQEEVRKVLDATPICEPRCPVYSNATGQPFSSADAIRHLLAEQLTSPVLWSSIASDLFGAAAATCKFVELGPGRSLTASMVLNKRSVARQCSNVQPT